MAQNSQNRSFALSCVIQIRSFVLSYLIRHPFDDHLTNVEIGIALTPSADGFFTFAQRLAKEPRFPVVTRRAFAMNRAAKSARVN